MSSPLKVIIPTAGFGSRLRPHTWSRPKPLVSVAGKPVLAHVLDTLQSAPQAADAELVFIVGYLGDQIQAYMQAEHPQVKAHFVQQEEMLGQSHAIAMAREYMQGPLLILFVDTIVETDFGFLGDEEADAVIWVKEVEDPRRFGVVDLDDEGWVQGLIEKPDSMDNNRAIVGIYYFARGEDLLAAIDRQIAEDVQTKGEYFLADAMDLMLKDGLRMRPQDVGVWLDAGLPATVLETNRYLLEHGRDNSMEVVEHPRVKVDAPVFVHPSAEVEDSRIGPGVSIGPDCVVRGSRLVDSVLEAGAQVLDSDLQNSLIGQRARVQGIQGEINIGDDSVVQGKS